MFESVRECLRLRLVYPQVVRNYVSSRKTRKRKSTIYLFKDGSSLEKRKSRFVTWCPDHKPIKCRTMTDRAKVGRYIGSITCLTLTLNKETGEIEGAYVPPWARLHEFDTLKTTILLSPDDRLNVFKRIQNVAFWFGYANVKIGISKISKDYVYFRVAHGTNYDLRDFPTFL